MGRPKRKRLGRRKKAQIATTTRPEQVGELSEALEDYLEIIYHIGQRKGRVHIKDIASEKHVRMPSVTDAVRRLRDHDMVEYQARGTVELTPAGRNLALLVVGRHQFLKDFFTKVLGVPGDIAERDACSIEHDMSTATLAKLASFYQFLTTCPKVSPVVMEEWKSCCSGTQGADAQVGPCSEQLEATKSAPSASSESRIAATIVLSQLRPGERARIVGVRATASVRQRLVEMGVLPDVPIEMEGMAPLGDPLRVRLRGYVLSLRRSEANSILVVRDHDDE
ncbi:MAG: DtxR family transcriptional regulator [Deltaproteobacteria bacterium]|nr:DtxR family transcriptional regulator [Deltaproteobacteria bacterium]